MNSTGKTATIVALAAALFGGGLFSGSMIVSNADGLMQKNQPGSVNDPIVTKSYVDESVQKLVKSELSKINVSSSGAKLTIVALQSGETLFAGEGTEFIVRNGKTIAYSNDGNGIPDLTAGKDIQNGATVENNHLLMFPREGRGIKSASSGTIYVMVRGSYLHLDKDGNTITP